MDVAQLRTILSAHTSDFDKKMDAADARIKKFAGQNTTARLDLDIQPAMRKLNSLINALGKTGGQRFQVSVDADLNRASMLNLQGQLRVYANALNLSVPVTPTFSTSGPAATGMLNLQRSLAQLQQLARIRVTVDIPPGAAGRILDLQRSFNQLSNLADSLRVRVSGMRNTIAQLNRETSSTSSIFDRAGSSVFNFATGYLAVRTLTDSIRALKDATIGFNSEQQKAEIALTYQLGSREAALKRIASLQRLAVTTPLTSRDIMPISSKMEGSGLVGSAANIRVLGDQLAKAGTLSTESLSHVVHVLGQISQGARANTRDMQQFSDYLVPAVRLWSKELGVSTAKFLEMVEAGQITRAQLPAFFRAMEKDSKGSMDRMQATWEYATQSIGEAFQIVLGSATRKDFDEVTKLAVRLANVLSSPTFRKDAGKWVTGTINDIKNLFSVIQAVTQGIVTNWNKIVDLMRDPLPFHALTGVTNWLGNLEKQIDTRWTQIGRSGGVKGLLEEMGAALGGASVGIDAKTRSIEKHTKAVAEHGGVLEYLWKVEREGAARRREQEKFDFNKVIKGPAGTSAADSKEALKEAEKLARNLEKQRIQILKAARKAENDRLQDAVKFYDAMAGAAEKSARRVEDAARRQIDALSDMGNKLRELLGGFQESLAHSGFADNPLSRQIAQIERILNLTNRAKAVAAGAVGTLGSLEAQRRGYALHSAHAAMSLDRNMGGDANEPARVLKATRGRLDDLGVNTVQGMIQGIRSPRGMAACANFVSQAFERMGIAVRGTNVAGQLVRNARAAGAREIPISQVGAGDLVYQHGRRYGAIKDAQGRGYHVGIGIGDGQIMARNRSYMGPVWGNARALDTSALARGGSIAGGMPPLTTPAGNRMALVGGGWATRGNVGRPPADVSSIQDATRNIMELMKGFDPSLSRLSAVPKEWTRLGGAVKDSETSAARFKAQMFLADKATQNMLRTALGQGGFQELVRQVREAANATDVMNNRVAQLKDFPDRARKMFEAFTSGRAEQKDRAELLQLEIKLLTEGRLKGEELNDALEVEATRRKRIQELLKSDYSQHMAKQIADEEAARDKANRALARNVDLLKERQAFIAEAARNTREFQMEQAGLSGEWRHQVRSMAMDPDLTMERVVGFMDDLRRKLALGEVNKELERFLLEFQSTLEKPARRNDARRAADDMFSQMTERARQAADEAKEIARQYSDAIGSLDDQINAMSRPFGKARDEFLRLQELLRNSKFTPDQIQAIVGKENLLRDLQERERNLQDFAQRTQDILRNAIGTGMERGAADGVKSLIDQLADTVKSAALDQLSYWITNRIFPNQVQAPPPLFGGIFNQNQAARGVPQQVLQAPPQMQNNNVNAVVAAAQSILGVGGGGAANAQEVNITGMSVNVRGTNVNVANGGVGAGRVGGNTTNTQLFRMLADGIAGAL